LKGTITIPTEPIGSIPRPLELIHAVARGNSDDPALDPLYDAAIRERDRAIRGNRVARHH
jgi:hypothetical protein